MDMEFVLNRLADKSAKEARINGAPIMIDEAWNDVDEFFIIINGNLFEGNLRKWIYSWSARQKKDILFSSSNGERFDTTDLWVKPMINVLKLITLPSALKKFHLKCLSKSLPTLKYMKRCFGNIFQNDLCINCVDQIEDDIHIFSKCPLYGKSRDRIWEEITKTIQNRYHTSMYNVNTCLRKWIPNIYESSYHDTLWFLGFFKRTIKEDLQHI
jgi:hypothetical protein